jgi:glutaredoxin 3
MTMARKKIEIFTAGCPACDEAATLVLRLANSAHDVAIRDMHQAAVARKAKRLGIKSLPAIVIDGRLADCCAGRGPDEAVLRQALA